MQIAAVRNFSALFMISILLILLSRAAPSEGSMIVNKQDGDKASMLRGSVPAHRGAADIQQETAKTFAFTRAHGLLRVLCQMLGRIRKGQEEGF